MKARVLALLAVTHLLVGGAGFAAGIYVLPILTAPAAPSSQEVEQLAQVASYQARFQRDLEGSDFLHWGEGRVSIGPDFVAFRGKLAPGPNYKLYLSPEFVETEAAFEAARERMVVVGDIKTFNNFLIRLPAGVDLSRHTSLIVWCESFHEFITAARYR